MPPNSPTLDIFQIIACVKDRSAYVATHARFCTVTPTYRAAYEHLETIIESATGERRYCSYASFKVSKTREQRKKKPGD